MPDKTLTIDMPVAFERATSVHSIGPLQLEGDLPAAIFDLQAHRWRYRRRACKIGIDSGLRHQRWTCVAQRRRAQTLGATGLLSDIKVNLETMARAIDLAQQGFEEITE